MSASTADMNSRANDIPTKPLKVRIAELPWNGLIKFGWVITVLLICISIIASCIWMWVTGSGPVDKFVGVGLMALLILGSVVFQFYSGLAWGAGQKLLSVVLFCFVVPMEYYNILTGSGTLNLFVNRTVEREQRHDELYEEGKSILAEKKAQAATSRERAQNAPNTYMSKAGEAEERARQSTDEAVTMWENMRDLDVGGVTETVEIMENSRYGVSSENRNLGLIILCSLFPMLYIFFRGRIRGKRRIQIENIDPAEAKGKKP